MDYATAFVEQNRALGDVLRGGDPSTAVPTCPGWTLEQLFRHVGRGDRWAAQIVTDRVDQYLDPRTVEGGKPPADRDDAISWLHGGARRLVDAVGQAGVQAPVWTFIGPRPASWWIRRRLHETTVHRADAALALDVDYTLALELAADGISEWLEIAVVQAARGDTHPPLANDHTLHLHATDLGLGEAGEWTVSAADGRLSWSHSHGKGTVALRGAASDLLLATLRRVRVADTDIAVFGDAAVWQNWLDHTPF